MEDQGVFAYSINKTNCELKSEHKLAEDSGWENGYKQAYTEMPNDSTLLFHMFYGAKDFGDYQIWKRGSFYKTLIFTKEGMIEEIEHVSEIIPIDKLKEHFTYQDSLVLDLDSTLTLSWTTPYCPDPIEEKHLQDIYDIGLEKYLKKGNCFHSITQLRDSLTVMTVVFHGHYSNPQIRLLVFDKSNNLTDQLDVNTSFADGCCGSYRETKMLSDSTFLYSLVSFEGVDTTNLVDSVAVDLVLTKEGVFQELDKRSYHRTGFVD